VSIESRLKKLEQNVPKDEYVDFFGQQVKRSWIKEAIEAAEGTALRPHPTRGHTYEH